MYDLNPRTILVIDDDPTMREIFDLLLRSAGLTVRKAQTIPEARSSTATATDLDLILLDLHLDGHDGVELAKELASSHNQTPIVAVSASREPSLQERARSVSLIYG
jgi:two-component system, OmpR family, response regulator